MKTERLIYLLLILLLAFTNGYILYRVHINTKSIDDRPENIVDKQSLFNHITNLADSSVGLKVRTDMVLFNYTGEGVMLKDLAAKLPMLVFDFNKINCRTCIDAEFLRLIEIANVVGEDKILFISKFDNHREQYALEQKYNIQIFNSKEEGFGLPIEDEFVPFIFVIDSGFLTREFYVPTSEFYGLGNIYYSLVLNRYFGESWF